MNLEDTIEFYGFVPEQLLQDIEDTIANNISNDSETLSTFRSHFSIFKEYVLKNCFNFPEDFSFERKITDKRLEVPLQKNIDECLKVLDEIRFITSEKKRMEYENVLNKYKIERYERFLEDVGRVEMLEENNRKLENKIDEFEEAFRKRGDDVNESGIGMLLENEYFKREVENKEREDLVTIYDTDAIDDIIERRV